MNPSDEARGRIVRTFDEGFPIIWSYVPEMPAGDARRAMQWLMVVSWEYDGSGNNGMPEADENQLMLMLEASLGTVERPGFCVEAYRRIGAGLREFVYYIADREGFLDEFSQQVADDPLYPIEIKFYEDEAWLGLQKLIDDFRDASGEAEGQS